MRNRTFNHEMNTVNSTTTTTILPAVAVQVQSSHVHGSKNLRNPKDTTTLVVDRLTLQRNILLVICCILSIFIVHSQYNATTIFSANCETTSSMTGITDKNHDFPNNEKEECVVSFGKFKGHVYNSKESGTIGQPKCLVESKWLKLSQHTVQFPDTGGNKNSNSNNGKPVIYDDWLWIDYHDRINVLVEDEKRTKKKKEDGDKGINVVVADDDEEEEEERHFFVFEQTKYALEGRSSLAIIGGIIEPGEEPEAAARREVQEEMDWLHCETFHFLGKYRTDVNRGMGWLNSFLATDCSRVSTKRKHDELAEADEVGKPDTEKQVIKTLSLDELREAMRRGEFLEVQWTATVAQALLHPELVNG